MQHTKQTIALAIILTALTTIGCATNSEETSPDGLPLQVELGAQTIDVTSPDFEHGAKIPHTSSFDGFGCTGENKPITVRWSNAPEEAKSFAVIMHDPDAPTGVGFFHWVVVDIPQSSRELSATLPSGARTLHTDYGQTGYGGPCPPVGRNHRYVISVFALDIPKLELGEQATGALTRFVLSQHTIAMGTLVGTFGR